MVVDIPMGQGLLVGKECEKACEDNFLKCTHNVSLTSLSRTCVLRHFVFGGLL